MTTVGTNYNTLQDVAASMDPNGKVAKIVEILTPTNEILDYMPMVEGNLPTGHLLTLDSVLPTVYFRLLNYGVAPSKSKQVQVTESCALIEANAVVDREVAKINGNKASFMMKENRRFIISMNKKFADTLIYGNVTTDPEAFMGLDPRWNAISGAENATNIITGGGTESANTSIWIMVLGENAGAYCIYPKGSVGGLEVNDMGLQKQDDGAGGIYWAYTMNYVWRVGLAVANWKYICRICNIDVGDLTFNAGSGANLVDLIAAGLERVEDLRSGQPVIMCNRTVKEYLRRQMKEKANINLSWNEAFGRHVMTVDDVPVLRVDSILSTESTYS